MSAILPAKRICEEALGAISAFPTSESAADPVQLRRAMTWLDLIMGQEAGTGKLFFLIPATLSMPITNGTMSYNLNVALGSDLPPDKIQFPVEAWLEDASGRRSEIEIATFEKFEQVCNGSDTGKPTMIYIDRLPQTPTLRIYPTPAVTDTTAWTLKIAVQTFAPNVGPAGVSGNQPSGSVLTGFRQAWQRYLILALAMDLGSGPISKLPEASLTRFEKQKVEAKLALTAYENKEHDTEPPIGDDAWDGPVRRQPPRW